jgi:hypothetical protein
MAKTDFKIDKKRDYYRLVQRVPYDVWRAINAKHSESCKDKKVSKEQFITEKIFKPYLGIT